MKVIKEGGENWNNLRQSSLKVIKEGEKKQQTIINGYNVIKGRVMEALLISKLYISFISTFHNEQVKF